MVSPTSKESPKSSIAGPVISYTVQASDTLMSIAARFDTTPSELTKINRLVSRFLFPGQILLVPDKGGTKENVSGHSENSEGAPSKARASKTLSGDSLPPQSPSPAAVSTAQPKPAEVDPKLDRDCLDKFLKIKVKHITDGQGVVGGVLLVTPNAVMFDPNVSDPLVIERGSESYGLIAPMEYMVNVAIYFDIAHMKVKDAAGLPRPDIPKPEIYRLPSHTSDVSIGECIEEMDEEESNREDRTGLTDVECSPNKDTTLPELNLGDNDNDSSCSCGGETRDTSAFPKAFEEELLTPLESDVTGNGRPSSSPILDKPGPTEEDIRRGAKSASPVLREDNCLKPKQPLTYSSSLPFPTCHSSPNTLFEKKRATSVVSNPSSESEMPPVPEEEQFQLGAQETGKQKGLKRFYPLQWMGNLGAEGKECLSGILPPGMPGSASSHNSSENVEEMGESPKQGMFSNVFTMSNVSNMLNRRTSSDATRRSSGSNKNSSTECLTSPIKNTQSDKRSQYKEGKVDLVSMVSMDDMPDLFASFDKRWRSVTEKDEHSKLIPKPSAVCDDSPLYMCLRMGSPLDKPIPKSIPIMSYGRRSMRPEYWFSIPKTRADDIYRFFNAWSKDIYGEPDVESIRGRGFVLLDDELEISTGDLRGCTAEGREMDPTGELKEITKESWEVPMSDELRRALYSSNSLDMDVYLPELIGTSELINDSVRKDMYRKLPARVQGHNWTLVFSSALHGFSLKSLYRKMSDVDTPILIFIEDTFGNVFGAFLSCPLRVSDLFYGTGESFLFVCQPEFTVFPWTGENMFFVKGNNESLYIGGGEGNFGIWVDGDLYHGRSQSCKTFGNPALSNSEDFIVKTFECWYFS